MIPLFLIQQAIESARHQSRAPKGVAGRRFERVTQLASVGIATSPHDRRRPSFPEYDYHFAKDKTLRLAARQSSY
ncbi:hypothetical protein OAH22_00135 [bacterium]|nr:hypothetical protein [bacterium]